MYTFAHSQQQLPSYLPTLVLAKPFEKHFFWLNRSSALLSFIPTRWKRPSPKDSLTGLGKFWCILFGAKTCAAKSCNIQIHHIL